MSGSFQKLFLYCSTIKDCYPEDSKKLEIKEPCGVIMVEVGLQWSVTECRMFGYGSWLHLKSHVGCYRRLACPVHCEGNQTFWHAEEWLVATDFKYILPQTLTSWTWLGFLGNLGFTCQYTSTRIIHVGCCKSSCHSQRGPSIHRIWDSGVLCYIPTKLDPFS
jgi:hypothetical protein